jgi:hypothetical protein
MQSLLNEQFLKNEEDAPRRRGRPVTEKAKVEKYFAEKPERAKHSNKQAADSIGGIDEKTVARYRPKKTTE